MFEEESEGIILADLCYDCKERRNCYL